MKIGFKMLALGVAIAASATMAKADQLSGALNFGPTSTGASTYTFTLTGTVLSVSFTGGTTATAGGSPVISAYDSDTAAMGNFSFDTSTGVMTSFSTPEFAVKDTNANVYNGSILAFYDASSVPTVTYSYNSTTGFLDVTLYGGLADNYPGFDVTPATLNFSSQNVFFTATGTPGVYDSGSVSYSGTITALPSAAPEPGSLALLGTGLLGAAGIARRRLFGR